MHGRFQAYELIDWIVCVWYRLTYCTRYGHQLKMHSYGYCVNCGKRVRRDG